MNSCHLQISFMPWAGLNKEIKIGPLTFWPFSAQGKQHIQDKRIRKHLEEYFRCYVDHHGQPVDTITICSHGEADFRQLNEDEAAELRSAVDALMFSIICPAAKTAVCANNCSMGPPSSERYQLIMQNFHPGEGHIAVRAGSVLSGGWKIGEISFPMLWSTGGVFDSLDKKILEGFSKLYDSGFPAEARERVWRSLQWFRMAHVESDDVSVLSKVVMMATAFEIILDAPKKVSDKSGWIADEVTKRCAGPNSLKERRKDNKGDDKTREKIGRWTWDFYKLRNAIVHGDAISPEQLRYRAPARDWLTQLIVADLVFWELVMRELYDHGCLDDNVRKCSADWDKALSEEGRASETLLVPWFLGFNCVHRALCWLPDQEMTE